MIKYLSLMAILMLCVMPSYADIDNLDIGGDVSVWMVYTDNTEDFYDDGDDQDDFIRTELHLWFEADLADNVMARISLEADRAWNEEDADYNNLDGMRPDDNNLDVFVEEAYIKVSDIYDSMVSVQIGRQFITYGDGFVIGDSRPGNPSNLRTLGTWENDPFDAIKIMMDFDTVSLDIIVAKDAETRVEQASPDGDTDSYIAYMQYTGIEDHQIDAYFLFTNMDGTRIGKPNATQADVFALGVRAAGTIMEGLTYKAEFVYEFGEFTDIPSGTSTTDIDISAWAAELGLKYMIDMDYEPWIAFTYTYFSGDDDATDDDIDAYIQLFSSKTYGEIAEGIFFNDWALTTTTSGISPTHYGSHVFNLGGGFNITENLSASLQLYYFLADEDKYLDDDELGWELDGYLDYQFSEELSASLAAGFLDPGDAFENINQDDTAYFVRGGVSVSF